MQHLWKSFTQTGTRNRHEKKIHQKEPKNPKDKVAAKKQKKNIQGNTNGHVVKKTKEVPKKIQK